MTALPENDPPPDPATSSRDAMWAWLGRQRVHFWICVHPDHHYVDWVGEIAHCSVCGLTSDHTSTWIRETMRHVLAQVADEMDEEFPEAAARLRARAMDVPQ